MAKPDFIGREALTHVAEQVGTQIIMGPAYRKPELIKRMRIKVISGVNFKRTDTILVRKGGTTRRKVVGQPLNSTAGFLKERPVVVKLSWNHFTDNIDNYRETIFATDSKPGGSYPISTAACEAIMMTYAEDLTDNLFFGNVEYEGTELDNLSLYDGFHTNIAHDIEDGVISVSNGNLIETDAIEAPIDGSDSTPYDNTLDAYTRINPKLRGADCILCYCDTQRGIYIAQGYANKFHGNAKVVYREDGTFTIPEMPRVIFVPEDAFGVGDRLYFTIPENFQYAVDSEGNDTFVGVRVGSDNDMQDVQFQIQSAQGTRVLNPLAAAFAMTNGSLKENVISGDYRDSKLVVNCDDNEGSVTVNGEAYPNPVEFKVNDVITLVATPKAGYEFAGWSNGCKTTTLNLVATGMPMAVTAMFTEAQGS